MQYAWLIWSLTLLAIWASIYFSLRSKESRKEMLIVSLWTSLMGFTEPIFVPEYWNPPSLFDLAAKTGFDLESIIFSFAVGGLAVIIYEWIFKTKHVSFSKEEKHHQRHKYHFLSLVSAPVIFVFLLLVTNWNPIYAVIIALLAGGFITWYCRPDLKKKMIFSAFVFMGIYFLYFLTLSLSFPGYVEVVWNMSEISGFLIAGVPVEELMFAFSLGFLWSSWYEHVKWYKIKAV